MATALRFALGALLLVAPPLAAQEPADTVALPDLVISATPVPVRPDAVTSAVTVLSGSELRSRGIRFVHDALREVPGIFVVQQGSYGAVTSVFARGGESDYVKVLIDGVPANQPGGSFDFATLTTDNVERIEIVRGPVSVVHGSDAVTGVVQVFTRVGTPQLRARLTAGGGTYGTYAADAAVDGGGGAFTGSLGGSRQGTEGVYAFNNDFLNTVLSGAARATVDSRTRLAASFRAGWNRAEFPTDGFGVPSDTNQFSSGHTVTAGLEGHREIHRRVGAHLALTLTDTRYDFDDRMDDPGDTTGFAFASERRIDVRRVGGRLSVDIRPRPSTVLTLGAHLERDDERQQGSSTSNFGTGTFTESQPEFAHSRWNRAYYVQATGDLESGLGLSAGLRLDDNEAFGDFVTARAGISYRLTGTTRARATIGNAFKAPTFSENFAASPFETGNPELRPERTRSWELGIEQGFLSGLVAVSAALFDQHFRNLIQYLPAAPGEPTYENLGAASARGVEAGLQIVPAQGVSLSGQYTYLETEVTDAGAGGSPSFAEGERLLRRPSHAARAALRMRRSSLGVSVAAGVTGARDDIDFSTFERVTLPGLVTVDLAAELEVLQRRPGRPMVALLVRLENAFDERYQSVAGFPGRRRTLFAGARVER